MMLSFLWRKKNEPKHNCSIECLSNSYSLLGSSSFSWYFELMKKPYLLICGDDYDSQWQKGNWIGCYEFESEALSAVKKVEQTGGTRKFIHYEVEGDDHFYDWYEIVDLRDWAE